MLTYSHTRIITRYCAGGVCLLLFNLHAPSCIFFYLHNFRVADEEVGVLVTIYVIIVECAVQRQ